MRYVTSLCDWFTCSYSKNSDIGWIRQLADKDRKFELAIAEIKRSRREVGTCACEKYRRRRKQVRGRPPAVRPSWKPTAWREGPLRRRRATADRWRDPVGERYWEPPWSTQRRTRPSCKHSTAPASAARSETVSIRRQLAVDCSRFLSPQSDRTTAAAAAEVHPTEGEPWRSSIATRRSWTRACYRNGRGVCRRSETATCNKQPGMKQAENVKHFIWLQSS